MNQKQKLLCTTVAVALGLSTSALAADSKAETLNKNQQNNRINRNVDRPYTDLQRIDKFLGIDLQNEAGEKLGDIKDAVIDLESGRILYTLVGVDGKQGLVALPPQLLRLTQDRSAYRGKINKELLNDAPTVTKDRENLGEVSFAGNVYKHFNQQAWWEGPNSATSRANFGNVHKLSEIRNMKVQNVQNVDIGKVDNVVLDLDAGRLVFLTLSTGGVVNRDPFVYAVPPNALTMGTDKKVLIIDTDKEKLANSPKFRRDSWPDLRTGEFSHNVYKHYGKQAYFEPTSRPGAGSRIYQNNNQNQNRNN